MKFQFTNSTLGSKNILLSAINKMLQVQDFKDMLLHSVEETPLLKENTNLKTKIKEGKLDLDAIEFLKNELMSPILKDTVVFGGKGSDKNPREILQGLGDELRGINSNIFLGFLAKDLLSELEGTKERIDPKSFIGGSGTGKDTIGQFFFYSATDGRTVSEMDFLEGMNACLSYEDQKSYLKSFMFNLDLSYGMEGKPSQGFEGYLYESINDAVNIFNKEKPTREYEYHKDPNPKELITFISRPILSKDEYPGEDYKEYEQSQKNVYLKNNIPFTEANKEMFGYIREGVNVHHYTEKLNQIIRIYNNSKGKNPEQINKELEYVLSFGNLKDDQKKEFKDYYVALKNNPNKLEVIENKFLDETKSKVIEGIFKKAIDNCKGDFKLIEYEDSNVKNNPMEVIQNTTIFFDFDDVIVEFVPEWLKYVNKKLNTNHALEEITEYWWFDKLSDRLLKEGNSEEEVNDKVWDFLQSDIYQNIEKNENIIEIMRLLKQMGFTVKILTAESSVSKQEFVKEHIDFLDHKKDIVATGDKHIVEGNCVLVDDGGHNVENMVIENEEAHCVLIDRTYNQHIKTYGELGRITRTDITKTGKILDLIIAKAYASNARKNDFVKSMERLGVELNKEQMTLLKDLPAQEAINILTEALKGKETNKGKYP